MAGCFDSRLPIQSLLVAASIFAVYGFSPGNGTKDPRVQDRLYGHLDRAERAITSGNCGEATAYAEMVLLRRDVTVFVDEANVPYELKEHASRSLRTAAVNWEDALGREIKFRFVPYRDADVFVRYADGMKYDGKDAAGTVRWTRQVMSLGSGEYRYEVRANVTLRTRTPQGATMNYAQMLHTAGHELGHILGLEDSAKQGELMGPLRLDRPVERATRAEKDSLLTLRRQANDILARIEEEDAQDEPSDYGHIVILVVSDATVSGEVQEPRVRNDRGQRRADLVRSPVRDGQAPTRKTGFAVTGMAR